MECIYNLLTFGIPKEALPIDPNTGICNLENQHSMLQRLRRIEESKKRMQAKDLDVQNGMELNTSDRSNTSSNPSTEFNDSSDRTSPSNDTTGTTTITESENDYNDANNDDDGDGMATNGMDGALDVHDCDETVLDYIDVEEQPDHEKTGHRSSSTLNTTIEVDPVQDELYKGGHDIIFTRTEPTTELPAMEPSPSLVDTSSTSSVAELAITETICTEDREMADVDTTVAFTAAHPSPTPTAASTLRVAPPDPRLFCPSPADTTSIILLPSPMDILNGRGKHPKNQLGNLRMHHMVEKYREEYEKAGVKDKTRIAERVVQELKDNGSRFLTSASEVGNGGGYVLCRDAVAREKVSRAFRQLRSIAPSLSSSSSATAASKLIDEQGSDLQYVVPGPMDVLMGRGRLPGRQAGNAKMHGLLEEKREEYERATFKEKTRLADGILVQMKRSGSRFLTQAGISRSSGAKLYIECDDRKARSKISHGFRHLRSQQRRVNHEDTGAEADVERTSPVLKVSTSLIMLGGDFQEVGNKGGKGSKRLRH